MSDFYVDPTYAFHVDYIDPDHGPAGTLVTTHGTWLQHVDSVKVGDVSATILTSGRTRSELQFTVPEVQIGEISVVTSTLPSAANWRTVTYGGGKFVVVTRYQDPSNTRAATSPDGITWTTHSLPVADTDWHSITYGNGVFVALADESNFVATSPDGATWTQRTLPIGGSWKSVAYGAGKFVAVANNIDTGLTSPDGITWTEHVILAGRGGFRSLVYGNGKFVVVSDSFAATSIDGINWTEQTLPTTANWYYVTFGNGIFVAVASNSNIAATSPDGVTWTQRTLPASKSWNSVTYGANIFVAVAYASDVAAISSDAGATWTAIALPSSAESTPLGWQSITYGDGKFLAVAYASDVAAIFVAPNILDVTFSTEDDDDLVVLNNGFTYEE